MCTVHELSVKRNSMNFPLKVRKTKNKNPFFSFWLKQRRKGSLFPISRPNSRFLFSSFRSHSPHTKQCGICAWLLPTWHRMCLNCNYYKFWKHFSNSMFGMRTRFPRNCELTRRLCRKSFSWVVSRSLLRRFIDIQSYRFISLNQFSCPRSKVSRIEWSCIFEHLLDRLHCYAAHLFRHHSLRWNVLMANSYSALLLWHGHVVAFGVDKSLLTNLLSTIGSIAVKRRIIPTAFSVPQIFSAAKMNFNFLFDFPSTYLGVI